jgi:hypothetical protein
MSTQVQLDYDYRGPCPVVDILGLAAGSWNAVSLVSLEICMTKLHRHWFPGGRMLVLVLGCLSGREFCQGYSRRLSLSLVHRPR